MLDFKDRPPVSTRVRSRRASVRHETITHSLPDPQLRGPFVSFKSDPGRDEEWWWLWLPVALAVALVAIFQVSDSFYREWVLPEGYGFLEFNHFIISGAAAVVGLSVLLRPFVRRRPAVFGIALVGGLSCLYISGEEMSWGQHLFHWDTPEQWAALNRQEETNFHNMYDLFDKTPRNVLMLSVIVGGILIPLLAAIYPKLRAMRWSLFFPPVAIVPTALLVIAFQLVSDVQKVDLLEGVVQRPSEVVELYLYFFLLIYMMVFARRVRELEAAEGAKSRA
jgi:hypothetical protein